jgi:hypothetical protein
MEVAERSIGAGGHEGSALLEALAYLRKVRPEEIE